MMECRSVWAGRFVLCMAAGAASSLGKGSPWAGSSRTDRIAWETQNNKDSTVLFHFNLQRMLCKCPPLV